MTDYLSYDEAIILTLESLASQLENHFDGKADINLEDGVLEVCLETGETYLLNRHQPTKQLWLSSPKSGAWHFSYNHESYEIHAWKSTRNDTLTLAALLEKEMGLKAT